MKGINISTLLVLCFCFFFIEANAQYFGKNKPKYEQFDFEVYQSPNFDIYHYLENKDLLQELAQQSEHWYQMHQEVLKDTIQQKNPLLFYNNHADFQQTNAISGSIGTGTGGVTEALKNRVIMPLTHSNEQTNHVLGHELVHAFQYNMIINGDSTSLRNMANLPLWMVEGLAEYLSIGRVDAHTAMWMRDAVLNDDIPSIKKLSNPKYFPYRYGQAFWAFLTGVYSDDIIEPFFRATAQYGLEIAVQRVLNTNVETLSGMWTSALSTYYKEQMKRDKEEVPGKQLIYKGNAGRMNISPVISPNGRHVIFLSEKDLFSLDLFLADARTGKVIRKVASTVNESHIDDFSSMESAGTWSPNSRQFAIVAIKKGGNILLIKDVEIGKTVEEIEIKGVPALSNPAWSPDGKSLLVSGLVDGQPDLFLYHLKSKTLTQLTNDRYAEIQANWSADGQQIVYSTDRLSMQNGRHRGHWTFNLAVYDRTSGASRDLPIFLGADNLNPVFDHEGAILFLSDRDGFRNMYKYDPSSEKVYQMTDLLTGISGITKYSPAISASRKRDRLLFSHYQKNGYSIYQANSEALLNKEVDPTMIDMSAATLPVVGAGAKDIVNTNLAAIDSRPKLSADAFSTKEYRPKFKLDYVGGGAGVGVGSSSTFGTQTGLAGGVDFLFSDILGDNQLYAGLSLNGEIQDFGGQLMYLNRKNRIAWGARLSHIPYRTGQSFNGGIDTLQFRDGTKLEATSVVTDLWRIFEDQVGVFAQLPINKSLRVEVGGAFTHYGYRIDRFTNYYETTFFTRVAQDREKIDAPDGFSLFSTNAALVGDNAYFGLTSPLQGYRYRLGVDKYFGEWDFFRVTADYRKYLYTRPVSFAFRALHFGNYGKDANQFTASQYVGNPMLVRGYGVGSYSRFREWGIDFDNLTGSKMLVSNFEVRLPFTGPEQLAAIKSKFFLSDLSLFVDGGVAFDSFDEFKKDSEGGNSLIPKAIFSTGVSLRVNLFGALILEPYYAFPIQQNTKGVFGLNIVPGW